MDLIDFSQVEQLELRSMGVEAVVLFGSKAVGLAGADSDYDVAVLTTPGGPTGKIYDRLYDLLSEKINSLVDIDIVFLTDAPLELQSHVAKYGRVLYQGSNKTFARFKERVMTDYADFAPLRQMFQQATLERISV